MQPGKAAAEVRLSPSLPKKMRLASSRFASLQSPHPDEICLQMAMMPGWSATTLCASCCDYNPKLETILSYLLLSTF